MDISDNVARVCEDALEDKWFSCPEMQFCKPADEPVEKFKPGQGQVLITDKWWSVIFKPNC